VLRLNVVLNASVLTARPRVRAFLAHAAVSSAISSSSAAADDYTFTTRFCSTDSERPHRCCHLPHNAHNIDSIRPIFPIWYLTMGQTEDAPPKKNCPFPWDPAPPNNGSLIHSNQSPYRSVHPFFVGLMVVTSKHTERRTDHATSVTTDRI